MKRVETLHETGTWVFDLDNTLYPSSCGLMADVSARMTGFVAEFLGVDRDSALAEQKRLFREHGTTLRGLMNRFDVDPIAFMDYVHAVDYSVVTPSARLTAALDALPGRKVVFTNASENHAERVLERLGLADAFDGVFDVVAAGYRPKPDPHAYASLAARFDVAPADAVMVEDIAPNLAPAAALGMTTVWIRPAASPEPYWASPEGECDYIHHEIEDLADWLEDILAHGADREAAPG